MGCGAASDWQQVERGLPRQLPDILENSVAQTCGSQHDLAQLTQIRHWSGELPPADLDKLMFGMGEHV